MECRPTSCQLRRRPKLGHGRLRPRLVANFSFHRRPLLLFFFGRSRACSSRWGSVCVCVCSSRGSIDDQVVGGACRRRLGLTLGRGGGHRNGRVTHGRRSKRRRRHQTATAGTTLVSVELEKSKKKTNKFGAVVVVVGRRLRFASSSRCNLAPRCEVLDSWNLVADFL